MAISPDIESGPFVGNGAQTAFAFTFTAITPAEVAVELDGVAQSAGFTVTLADIGGTVTFAAAPATGVQITLRSSPDYLQDSVFENEGAYNLATVNTINRRAAVRSLVTKERFDALAAVAKGDPGPANALSIGVVTKVAAGGDPTASITGVSPDQVLNLGLVTGNIGATGATGSPGYTSTDTWTHLAAITPAGGAGSTGFALGPDNGTHTDANGLTNVPNTGQFFYQVSPGGWIRSGPATSPGDAALANQSLTTFVGSSETIGIAPGSDVAGVGPGTLIFINATSTYDSTLDSFTASVRTIGNGTGRLVAVLNNYAVNREVVVGEVLLTGISSTGVKTFTAGVDYNLLDANSQPIVFPAGTRFALGSTSGAGAGFDVQVSLGAGFSLPGTAGGYTSTQATGTNFIGKFQVTLGRVKSVRNAITAAIALPVNTPGETLLTDYCGPDFLVFDAVGDQGQSIYFGNGLPFYNDGQIAGVQYSSAVAGDVYWIVFRASQIVDWRRATLALGDRLTSTFATPFAVKAGDTLLYLPISGYLKSQNFSAIPGVYSTTSLSWNAAAFATLGVQPAMRAIVQRPRRPRKIAAASARGTTLTLDQRFRGTALPGNTTFTATTTNGSYTLTGITGTPVVGAQVTGAGITSAASPYIVSVSGNTALMSQPATANSSIVVTQVGWAAAGTGAWTCNDGLISPGSVGSPAATDWARRYVFPVPINAQRRTFTCSVLVGDLTNVGGICSQAQQASLVTTLGSAIHIDAPNNMFRAYLFGSNVGVAPPDAGLSVAAPWTLAATDWINITVQIERGQMTITFANAKTGQSAQIASRWVAGSTGRQIHAGVFSGQPAAHFLQGNGGMKWDFMRNYTHIANRGPRKFWYHDSTCHLTSDNWDFTWAARVEDQRGKGDFLNCAKAGTTALGVLSTLPQDFAAFNPGPGDEVFWGVGVNVDNTLGTTDAQRYSAWQVSTQAALNSFLQAGVTVTFVTPTPSNALPTYVPMVINGILSGVLGNIPYVNVGQAVSQSLDGALWISSLSKDNLHPFEMTGAASVAANFLAQRPDMNGSV